MLSKNVETLKNMNASTAKYAKWYVRVVDPKVKEYSFQARAEKFEAQKFECVLVAPGSASAVDPILLRSQWTVSYTHLTLPTKA